MLHICEQYKAELARLHGQEYADASIVQPGDDGTYLVSIVILGPDGYELDPSTSHSLEEMRFMLAELAKRKLLIQR